jgi:SAM-dependent methyltransferase
MTSHTQPPTPAAIPAISASHCAPAPSAWIARFAHLVRPQGSVLDLACGMGRHTRFFSALNHTLTSVDKAPEARCVADIAETITADIENNAWPLTGRSFDGVVVTNYLWRPLWPLILDSVKPGGVLLYETFAQGNEAYGKPSRPDFLLAPASCCKSAPAGTSSPTSTACLHQPARVVQRIAAIRPDGAAAPAALASSLTPFFCIHLPDCHARLRPAACPRRTPQSLDRVARRTRRQLDGWAEWFSSTPLLFSVLLGDARHLPELVPCSAYQDRQSLSALAAPWSRSGPLAMAQERD